ARSSRLTPRFYTPGRFEFETPLPSPWSCNNRVPGRLHTARPDWQQQPAVILIHGWNGEYQYCLQFPWLAGKLAHAGFTVIRFLLPYHGSRKPRGPGAVRNFISADPLRTVEAVQQALVEISALAAWLQAQGAPRVGLWGISLGAWLAAMTLTHDDQIDFGVVMTPVADMARALAELPFCAPARRTWGGGVPNLEKLDPALRQPRCDRHRVLIVKSEYDLFAPGETVERLWKAWHQPDIWRVPHGHISVLFSLRVTGRVVEWLAEHGSRP
ncbi:MAG TPA: alpha/beta fold hydrolase, partial [Methylomirabilota bacterium]|nr:alpha/beta fold hydrolase [Methylomirabilota bacterium]